MSDSAAIIPPFTLNDAVRERDERQEPNIWELDRMKALLGQPESARDYVDSVIAAVEAARNAAIQALVDLAKETDDLNQEAAARRAAIDLKVQAINKALGVGSKASQAAPPVERDSAGRPMPPKAVRQDRAQKGGLAHRAKRRDHRPVVVNGVPVWQRMATSLKYWGKVCRMVDLAADLRVHHAAIRDAAHRHTDVFKVSVVDGYQAVSLR